MLVVAVLNHPSSSYATSHKGKLYRRKGFYFTHAMSHKKHTIPSTETQRYIVHCMNNPIAFGPVPFEHLIIHLAFKSLSWLVNVSPAVAVACHLLVVTFLLREG